MIERLVAVSIVPLIPLVIGGGYAALAAHRLSDPRIGLFTVVLLLMGVHQLNEIQLFLQTGVPSASTGFGEYPETGVNLLSSVAVVHVLGLVRTEQTLSDRLTARLDRIRELERENDRLEEFAAVVSHDLRSPLTVAHGQLQMARETPDAADHFDAVERALDRMDEMVSDTLGLARHGVTDPEPVAVGSLATECWRMIEPSDATVDVRDSVTVSGDPDRHLFENLFRNAVDHGGRGVNIRVGSLPDDEFYVEDDGPGVAPDQRGAVFDLGHTDAADGSGFGLAIVARVADAHDWSVSVTESDEGGTRFEFRARSAEPPSDGAADRHPA